MLKIDVLNDKSELIQYNLPDMPIYINKLFAEIDHDFSLECHWHEDVEFVLVTHGQLQYNINGKCVTLGEGQGVFVNSRQMHHGFSVGKNVCECITIIFSTSLICPNDNFQFKYINPVTNNKNLEYMLLSDELFDKLLSVYDVYSKEADCIFELQSLFYGIWSVIYANMPTADVDVTPNREHNESSLKEMIAFIHMNYAHKLTLADISSAGKVCRSKCCNLFKEYLHQTPTDYLTVHRLRKAVVLLANKSEPMSEVAANAGFTGASYFAEIFRRHYNCTPSEYRNRVAAG
jgi:AraC-like DNA-binding protein